MIDNYSLVEGFRQMVAFSSRAIYYVLKIALVDGWFFAKRILSKKFTQG